MLQRSKTIYPGPPYSCGIPVDTQQHLDLRSLSGCIASVSAHRSALAAHNTLVAVLFRMQDGLARRASKRAAHGQVRV